MRKTVFSDCIFSLSLIFLFFFYAESQQMYHTKYEQWLYKRSQAGIPFPFSNMIKVRKLSFIRNSLVLLIHKGLWSYKHQSSFKSNPAVLDFSPPVFYVW